MRVRYAASMLWDQRTRTPTPAITLAALVALLSVARQSGLFAVATPLIQRRSAQRCSPGHLAR